MKDKLIPVGLNELLGRPLDVSMQPANLFYLLRHDQLDSLYMRSGPTPELTGREFNTDTDKLTMKIKLTRAPVQ
jgi:hypothetical protein